MNLFQAEINFAAAIHLDYLQEKARASMSSASACPMIQNPLAGHQRF